MEHIQETTNESFYYQLFLDHTPNAIETDIIFTMIEPEHADTFLGSIIGRNKHRFIFI